MYSLMMLRLPVLQCCQPLMLQCCRLPTRGNTALQAASERGSQLQCCSNAAGCLCCNATCFQLPICRLLLAENCLPKNCPPTPLPVSFFRFYYLFYVATHNWAMGDCKPLPERERERERGERERERERERETDIVTISKSLSTLLWLLTVLCLRELCCGYNMLVPLKLLMKLT
jgi:hypothetical protein